MEAISSARSLDEKIEHVKRHYDIRTGIKGKSMAQDFLEHSLVELGYKEQEYTWWEKLTRGPEHRVFHRESEDKGYEFFMQERDSHFYSCSYASFEDQSEATNFLHDFERSRYNRMDHLKYIATLSAPFALFAALKSPSTIAEIGLWSLIFCAPTYFGTDIYNKELERRDAVFRNKHLPVRGLNALNEALVEIKEEEMPQAPYMSITGEGIPMS